MLKAAMKQGGWHRVAVALACLGTLASAQTKAPASQSAPTKAPAKAASASASAVDNVIQLVKDGMSETLIIKTLKKQNHPIDLTSADLVKLQRAGVSENIINVMEDPSSTPSANATAAAQGASGAAPSPAITAAAANSLVAAAKSAPAPAAAAAPTMTPTAGADECEQETCRRQRLRLRRRYDFGSGCVWHEPKYRQRDSRHAHQ